MRIKLAMPVAEHEVWTQQAVDGLIGQTPMFEGEPATVIEAKLEDGQPYITLEVPDSFGPQLRGNRDLSVSVESPRLIDPRPSLLDTDWPINDG
jgi:hypothetical protein